MPSKDFCISESPKIILSMSSKDFCDLESPKIILSMSSKDFCNSCNSNWIQNYTMQSSDLKVSIIRSDYPSNAQGNDQREFSASCLRHLKTFLYPDDFTSRSSYPKRISQVHSCSRLFLFPQGRSGDKNQRSFDAIDHLRASNASIRTKNLANFLEYFSDK